MITEGDYVIVRSRLRPPHIRKVLSREGDHILTVSDYDSPSAYHVLNVERVIPPEEVLLLKLQGMLK